MPRIPGSQSRSIMQEKAKLAIQLYERGLTVRQISVQLRCSQAFVRRVRDELQQRAEEAPHRGRPERWNGVERRSGSDRRSGKDRRSVSRAPSDRRSGLDRRGHPFYQGRPPAP